MVVPICFDLVRLGGSGQRHILKESAFWGGNWEALRSGSSWRDVLRQQRPRRRRELEQQGHEFTWVEG